MKFLLPLLAGAYAVGVVLGATSVLSPWVMLVATAFCATLGLLSVRRPFVALILLFVAAVSCGTTLCIIARRRPRPACHVAWHLSGQPVRFAGQVLREPVPSPSGWRVLLGAEWLAPLSQRGERPTALCGSVEIYVTMSGTLRAQTGDRLLLITRLKPAAGGRNPGAGAASLRFLSDDVGAVGSADPRSLVTLGAPAAPLLERARRCIRGAVRRGVPWSEARGLIEALVLGDQAGLNTEVRTAFSRSGLSHIVAVSGLHLSLVAGGALVVLRWLLLWVGPLARRTDMNRWAGLLAIGVALGYTVLTGASPPTVRSCVMASACFVGLVCSRPPDTVRPLSLAGLGLLAADPLHLFRPSFQLSFAAVAGIGLMMARAGSARSLRWRGLRTLVLSSIAATLLTTPLVAHHFYFVSAAGLVANLVAIPLTTWLLLPLALIGAVLAPVQGSAAAALLHLAGYLAQALLWLAEFFAASDLVILPWQPGWSVTLGVSALLVGLLVRQQLRWLCLGAATLLLAAVTWNGAQRWLNPPLEAVFLDVGQGDSTFLRLPDGAAILVDAGGSYHRSWDPGARRVVPFLRSRGVRRLELVVASHPHPDHVAGLAAVLDSFAVGELWVCWHGAADPWHAALLAQAARRGVRVQVPRVVRRGGVTIRPLWPTGSGERRALDGIACGDPSYSANDNSIALRVEYGRAALLLPGDVEREAERTLLERERLWLRSQVIKVPHHGSATSSTRSFLQAVRPELAVISAGPGNQFGFPSALTLEGYHAIGATVARIDQLGAVSVQLARDGALSWSSWSGLP